MVNIDFDLPYTEEESRKLNKQLKEWQRNKWYLEDAEMTSGEQFVVRMVTNAKTHKEVGSLVWGLAEYIFAKHSNKVCRN